MTEAVDARTEPITAGIRLPESMRAAVAATLTRAVGEHWASRTWDRDTSLWTSDAGVAEAIANRLGWLDAPARFGDEVEELTAFGGGIAAEGFSHAIVCGMGGSSLAPDVLAHAFPRSEHGLDVRVLDSTDPQTVAGIEPAEEDARALHVIATKSGTTTETLAFLAHFWELAEGRIPLLRRGHTGDSFVAITDPGESVRSIPHSDGFREVFLNPPDVGGRYSALTYVGLVPGALMGLELAGLLGDAAEMAGRCRADDPANPGIALGATIGALAVGGRDKLTFVLEPDLAEFGAWVEQLIAESTGKHGTGVVPVDGEPLGAPEVYGPDRVFVRIGRRIAGRLAGRHGREAGRAGCGRPPGHRHRPPRRRMAGWRVLPLGVRDRHRRHRPGREPLRRAERDRIEGEHQGRPGALPPRGPPPGRRAARQ